MNWVTVYDISDEKYLWMDITLIVMILFAAFWIFMEIRDVKNGEKKISVSIAAKISVLTILFIGGILAFYSDASILKGNLINRYQRAYNEGNYACITGIPSDIQWDNGGFFFEVDGTKMICEMNYGKKRNENVVPYFEDRSLIRVFYYDDEMYDEANAEYMVLRIDVK